MAEQASNRKDRANVTTERTFPLLFTLWVSATACAIVLLSVPRAIHYELPVLVLPESVTREARQRERELLARVPQGDDAHMLYQLLLEAGQAELGDVAYDERRWRAQKAALFARASWSDAQLSALCALAAERFMKVLAGEALGSESERRGVVGAHVEQLIQHGYIDAHGARFAPELSVRATYKVRWNMLWGFPYERGLLEGERLAHEGFRALEARNLPAAVRSEALRAYLQLRGREGRDAWLIWQAMTGEPEALVQHLRGSPDARSKLRLRNMGVRAARDLYAAGLE